MLVMLAAPRAEACPNGTVCVSVQTRTETPAYGNAARREIAPARSMVQLAFARAERTTQPDPLAVSLRTHRVPRASAVEMPWVWRMIRTSVYSRMPRYDRVSQERANRFSLIFSPVVVESPQDTVPGLGVEGGF